MTDSLSMDFPAQYRIQVRGAVNERWFEYYDNMAIEIETEATKRPLTTLTGCVRDQAALQGMLSLLYDMQFPLVSVKLLPDE